MDKFREKIKRFINYDKDYLKANIVLIILTLISIVMVSTNNSMLETIGYFVELLLMLSIPYFFIEKTDKYNKPMMYVKHYIIEYLKIYAIFLIIFLISVCLLVLFYSIYFIMAYSTNIHINIIFFFLIEIFIWLESMLNFMNIFPSISYSTKSNYGIFKSIRHGRKLMKKYFFKHMLSVLMTGVLLSPFIMIYSLNISYLSEISSVVYILILFEFAIFDIKEKIEEFSAIKDDKSKNKFFKNKFANKNTDKFNRNTKKTNKSAKKTKK